MSMVRSSYIIIVSVMGDDVPILGALATLFGGDGLLPPKLIILQMCNKITEPNSLQNLQPLNYGSICPEMGSGDL